MTACSVMIGIVLILGEVVCDDTSSFFKKFLSMLTGLVKQFLVGWFRLFKGGKIAFVPIL